MCRFALPIVPLMAGCGFDYFLARLDGTVGGEAVDLQSGFYTYEPGQDSNESVAVFLTDLDEGCQRSTDFLQLQIDFFDADSNAPDYEEVVEEYVQQYELLFPEDSWSFSLYFNAEGKADDLVGVELSGIALGEMSNTPGSFSAYVSHPRGPLEAEIIPGDGFTTVEFHREVDTFESDGGSGAVQKHKQDSKFRSELSTTLVSEEDEEDDISLELKLEHCPEYQAVFDEMIGE